jgi:dienelactone hydrolase
MIIIALIPAIILPQYEPIKTTGEFSVDTVSYTLIDESREEFFTGDDDKRKLTIQFWYPSTGGKFPLVIFSHGAFGYRLSNYSTYQELASNGYIVCSIDHTYHAFMTNHEDGKVVIANLEFINNAMGAQAGTLSAEEVDKMEDEWMELRTADMSFVMDYIKNMVSNPESDGIFNNIDLDHIGLFGHSLGGATSAQVGRINNDVDAVIVIDGTMLGENRENSPYPKPILNIFNESHYYNEAINNDNYPNTFACKDAPCSYKVVIKGSGHMNFTDLPIISPFLSKMLETEQSTNIDPRFCIEITNDVILQFFNKYLKDIQVEIAKEIIIN